MEKELASGRKVKLIDMTVDAMDICGDIQHFRREHDGRISVYGINKANTAWIRNGVESADDKFIKSLTESEKIELVAIIKHYNTMGE